MSMVFKLMVTISIYESLSRSLMAYAACALRRHGLRSLFSAFDRVCYADGIMPYEQPLRRWVVVSTSLAFVITTCGISLEVYGVYGSQDAQQLLQIHKYQGQQRLLLWSPYAVEQTITFSSCGFFLSFFFSSPNLSVRTLDVYHTSTHGVALVRI